MVGYIPVLNQGLKGSSNGRNSISEWLFLHFIQYIKVKINLNMAVAFDAVLCNRFTKMMHSFRKMRLYRTTESSSFNSRSDIRIPFQFEMEHRPIILNLFVIRERSSSFFVIAVKLKRLEILSHFSFYEWVVCKFCENLIVICL